MKNPKDLWSGLLFIAIGAAAIALSISGGYDLGSARKMGPGYFPVWLGGGLCAIGLMLVWRGLARPGPRLGRIALMPLALVTLGTVLFGLVVTRAGLAPAVAALVLVSALASVHFRWRHAVPLALGLAALCVLVFVKGLGLPVPVMPHVLGY